MAYVELHDVQKDFGSVKVIKNINAMINEREFIVILGPSGCGKSTFLRAIAGLESIDAGEIHISGKRVDTLPPKARGCAMVFQNYALYPHLTVRGNIGYGLRVARVPRSERDAIILDVAKFLELENLLERKPAQLSGGQRQRVAIARAIARKPKVFLFDEPLSNLDAKLRATMRIELRKLHNQIGATSVFVTHDQAEAMTLADRIIVINDGKIAQIGTPSEIYHKPSDLFVASFVGTPPMNTFPAKVSPSRKTIETRGGWRVDIPSSLPGLQSGQDLTIGIRPENIQLTERGLKAELELVENVGAQRLLHCRIGDDPVIVMDSSRQHLNPDHPLNLEFCQEEISFFDENARRIPGAR